MVRSMTGFGRCESADETHKFTVEIKSVNHRYFDANIRMPRRLAGLESKLRKLMKEKIVRGKIDMYVNYENLQGGASSLKYDAALAGQYAGYFAQMSEQLSIPNDLTASVLGRCPEVFVMEEEQENEDALSTLLMEAAGGAIAQFIDAREREGAHLCADLTEKLTHMRACVDEIERKSPDLIEEYKNKLSEKIAEVLGDATIDENRLATEVTIFADKICVDEETVRLKSHIQTALDTLTSDSADGVGKRLDFIAQEMNREANTILSKSSDLAITNIGITLKTEIEKVREQIQNLE